MKIRRSSVYKKWIDSLRDDRARYRILTRIKRLEEGNPGDVKPVGEGISEMRINYGPGYRVYCKGETNSGITFERGGISHGKNNGKRLEFSGRNKN